MIHFIWTIFKETERTKLCPQCGHENPADYNYCENCGEAFLSGGKKKKKIYEDDSTEVCANEPIEETVYNEQFSPEVLIPADDIIKVAEETEGDNKNNTSFKKKKRIFGILLGVVLIAAAMAVIVVHINDKKSSEYNAKIDEADKYMQELNYEKAEALYLDAIDIEPKEDEAYIKAADVYIAQERYDEAEQILMTGKEKAGGKKISKKLVQVKPYGMYDEYLKNTVIPEIGLADVDEEKDSSELNTGLISAMIEDFNKDEVPDMLTVSYENSESIVLTLSLYTCKNGNVELLDEIVEDYGSGVYGGCRYDVFTKTYEDSNFIISSSEILYPSEGCIGVNIYEIENDINNVCKTYYIDGLDGVYFRLNDKVISDYDYNAGMEDEDRIAELHSVGISTFTEALSSYGIDGDRIIRDDGYWQVIKFLECDEEDSSEKHICYIRHGFYLEDGSIDLGLSDLRYIFDYTCLRNRIDSVVDE